MRLIFINHGSLFVRRVVVSLIWLMDQEFVFKRTEEVLFIVILVRILMVVDMIRNIY